LAAKIVIGYHRNYINERAIEEPKDSLIEKILKIR